MLVELPVRLRRLCLGLSAYVLFLCRYGLRSDILGCVQYAVLFGVYVFLQIEYLPIFNASVSASLNL